MSKPRMTKARVNILQKLEQTHLFWGVGDKGGREYFFEDGSGASPYVVEGMLRAGLLQHTKTLLGPGQEIVRR